MGGGATLALRLWGSYTGEVAANGHRQRDNEPATSAAAGEGRSNAVGEGAAPALRLWRSYTGEVAAGGTATNQGPAPQQAGCWGMLFVFGTE